MYLTILFLPLIGFLLVSFGGRFFGWRGCPLITTFCVLSSALFSCLAFYEVGIAGSPCYVQLAPWFTSEFFDAAWGFIFDSLTVVILVIVTFVSTLVHIYSISYMGGDPHLPRFMSYLSLFTFFMLILVTADNLVQLFFGWEGVGLASYLLINFWYTRLQANKSAIKAMLVNRVGDFGLALGIFATFSLFKSVNFATIFACAPYFSKESFLFFHTEWHALSLICSLFFVGVVGKSAQLGLHTWLPDAMEGPTPVSALIHAATMVTAGVFLIARCSPVFEHAPSTLSFVVLTGALTAFFAATTGAMQNDLKRVIAYSTCSQLGYMVFVCGLSHYSVGIFHLMNHAFFKALLFLSAGVVIHALADEQDMRKMGGTIKVLPFTYCMMLIGSLALVGFPFLTGFYSKDVILEVAYAKYTVAGTFTYWLGVSSALLTSYYSFRLLFLTFVGPVNSLKGSLRYIHDAPFLIGLPLLLLAFGSIFVGYLAKDMMVGMGTQFWGNALFVQPNQGLLLESEYIPQPVKFIPIIFSLLGFFFALNLCLLSSGFSYYLKTSPIGRQVYIFLNKKWLVDKVYAEFVASPFLFFGYHISFKALDKGFLEIIGPAGITQVVGQGSRQLKKLQSGFIYHYALIMLCSLTFLIAFVGLWDFFSFFVETHLYFIAPTALVFYTD